MPAARQSKVDPKARAFAEAARQVRVWADAVRRADAKVEEATAESQIARGRVFQALDTQMVAAERMRQAQQRFEELCNAWREAHPEVELPDEDDGDG